MSSAFSAGNGRFMSRSSSTVFPPTVTTKAPLRGFSLLTSTVTPGKALASRFALVLNAPQLRGTSRVNGVDAASMAYELKKDAGRRPLAGLDLYDGARGARARLLRFGSRRLFGWSFSLGFLRHHSVIDGFCTRASSVCVPLKNLPGARPGERACAAPPASSSANSES